MGIGQCGLIDGCRLASGTVAPPLAIEERRSEGGRKMWLAPIASVLQGRGLFVSEQQYNTNRLRKNHS